MTAKKKKTGARGKYAEWITDEGLIKIEGWARDGLTDEQIAGNIGISRSTLNEWKKKYSDISDSLKRGKEVVDRQVENALLKRALGYQYDEVTRELGDKLNPETGEFEEVLMVTKTVTKEVAPDTTAQIFWLKNRKPNEWRDRKDIEHSGGIATHNPFEGLTEEQLRKLADGK
ncbi:transposase [Sporosarcina sp. P34]|uniref:helix-turn-helix domain-containing protein n=1 Tax=Sporosarcina sp. P34 TaxID=2048247 RepID=UPI000C16A0A8|nr:helix-turn-helix domain-containing protein [Sporosarcina sp. P34]PID16855.1 transposase [Sporosarcina sp. P34]